MIGGGMFDYWHRNEFAKIQHLKPTKIGKKSDKSGSSNEDHEIGIKPLTNAQLQSAYYSFVIGVCVSILFIFIEVNSFFIKFFNQII